MTPLDALRWCPHCRRATTNAPLPELAEDDLRLEPMGAGEPQGLLRRHYCLACRNIWQSTELPREFVAQLLDERAQAEELRREIAVLRFALASRRADSLPALRAA